jgi:hypothetical protein
LRGMPLLVHRLISLNQRILTTPANISCSFNEVETIARTTEG